MNSYYVGLFLFLFFSIVVAVGRVIGDFRYSDRRRGVNDGRMVTAGGGRGESEKTAGAVDWSRRVERSSKPCSLPQ